MQRAKSVCEAEAVTARIRRPSVVQNGKEKGDHASEVASETGEEIFEFEFFIDGSANGPIRIVQSRTFDGRTSRDED